ncbi:MAG TPA: hypothetical protein VFI11_08250 [Anaerolineales bacterium]|nr:hypothetical protein [Anaerolineales bacterium]
MCLPLVIAVFLSLSAALFVWFSRLPPTRLWRTAGVLVLSLAALRAGASYAGQALLRSNSGWIQIPAYALSLLSLPEAALFSIWPRIGSPSMLALTGAVLLGTSLWVFAVAVLASRYRSAHRDA